jgi:hypothetical protein
MIRKAELQVSKKRLLSKTKWRSTSTSPHVNFSVKKQQFKDG